MSNIDDLTQEQCFYLLKEVLTNSGWVEREDGLWDMPERKDIFSSSRSPLTLNDAIHINNAIVKLISASVNGSAISDFLKLYEKVREENCYAYMEMACTKATNYMAWITSHPRETHADRKILAYGQAETLGEACRIAIDSYESDDDFMGYVGESS